MYEIGDKVIYQGADKDAYKRVGVIRDIEEKDGQPQLTVEFDNGESFSAPIDDWSREFTNACRNASTQARDKQGHGLSRWDYVKWNGREYPVIDFIDAGSSKVKIVLDIGGKTERVDPNTVDKVVNACTSTNSVVRNAMAANRRVARNGESEQREIVEMNIYYLKKDLDKVVRGLDETKRWMGKYGDNRIASIDKAKGAVVQAIQQLKY